MLEEPQGRHVRVVDWDIYEKPPSRAVVKNWLLLMRWITWDVFRHPNDQGSSKLGLPINKDILDELSVYLTARMHRLASYTRKWSVVLAEATSNPELYGEPCRFILSTGGQQHLAMAPFIYVSTGDVVVLLRDPCGILATVDAAALMKDERWNEGLGWWD